MLKNKKFIGSECSNCKAVVDWVEIPIQCPNCGEGGTFWTTIFEIDGEWVGKDGYVREKSEILIIFKIKFENLDNLTYEEREYLDYSLVTVQTGNPLSKFVGFENGYGNYVVKKENEKKFKKELKKIEKDYEVKVKLKREVI